MTLGPRPAALTAPKITQGLLRQQCDRMLQHARMWVEAVRVAVRTGEATEDQLRTAMAAYLQLRSSRAVFTRAADTTNVATLPCDPTDRHVQRVRKINALGGQ